jgi:hypothetical protein
VTAKAEVPREAVEPDRNEWSTARSAVVCARALSGGEVSPVDLTVEHLRERAASLGGRVRAFISGAVGALDDACHLDA